VPGLVFSRRGHERVTLIPVNPGLTEKNLQQKKLQNPLCSFMACFFKSLPNKALDRARVRYLWRTHHAKTSRGQGGTPRTATSAPEQALAVRPRSALRLWDPTAGALLQAAAPNASQPLGVSIIS